MMRYRRCEACQHDIERGDDYLRVIAVVGDEYGGDASAGVMHICYACWQELLARGVGDSP